MSGMLVWAVWTEFGEYAHRELRGLFTTEALATGHCDRLRALDIYDACDVQELPCLSEAATSVWYYQILAHIYSDGREGSEYGLERIERSWTVWQYELGRAEGRLVRSDGNYIFIDVRGYDRGAVVAEYERLLAQARAELEEWLPQAGETGT